MKINGFQTSTPEALAVFREEKFGHVFSQGVGYARKNPHYKPRINYSLKVSLSMET